jgi:phosphoadenosine phosphosulfate reductase
LSHQPVAARKALAMEQTGRPSPRTASRLESRCAVNASSLLRLVIEDLYPGRVALVSSFGADAAALLHMLSQIDKATPVVFVDTGKHFPETLAYRDELCAFLGLTNVIVAEPKAETMA